MLQKVRSYKIRRWLLTVVACLALGAGLVLARFVSLQTAWWLWPLGLAAIFLCRRQSFTALILVTGVCFGLGWWRGSMVARQLTSQENLYHRQVTILGEATDDAVYGPSSQLEFSLQKVRVAGMREMVGNVGIRGFGETTVYRGDEVQVSGKLYPAQGNDVARISFAELHVLRRDQSQVNNLRRRFAAGMQSALPEPVASFGLGLLIGQRSTLPKATADQLKHVGLTHVIAVSGYNLTIIVVACRRLLAKRSKFQATASCLVLVGLFLLFTGSSPPIVRASIISLLAIGAWHCGRTIKPLVLLLVGAAITVVANPLYLWGSVSWYLSFLAFWGVLVVAPLVQKRLFGPREPSLLAGICIETVCASIMVIPYLLYIFGELSLVSLPANLLVVPFIPVAMLLALVAGLAGMFVPAIAGWLAWPAKMLLTYLLDVAGLLSRIPHTFVDHIGFSLGMLVASYAAIGLACLGLWHKTRRTKYAILTDQKESTSNVRTFQMVND